MKPIFSGCILCMERKCKPTYLTDNVTQQWTRMIDLFVDRRMSLMDFGFDPQLIKGM